MALMQPEDFVTSKMRERFRADLGILPIDPFDCNKPGDGTPIYSAHINMSAISHRDMMFPVPITGRPFRYLVNSNFFLLLGNGPDAHPDVGFLDIRESNTLLQKLEPFAYDPTNGSYSQGDIWYLGYPD
ncbi:MAG: hypothetical protein K1X53_04610 [Candidatus Sumerlaeaceae bacterium]|nr:hypothetical protein [Candidatus Sumerlaeaceae bacterium]